MVFDKTGTLTEEGLEILGFRGVNDSKKDGGTTASFGAFKLDIKGY
jgi:magnesium-transporting ATPase (P-type)